MPTQSEDAAVNRASVTSSINIEPGSVIYAYSNQANKFKRHLVLAKSVDGILCLTVYFNTKKPFTDVKHLERLQFHLKADGNSFLDHDSYANCAHPETINTCDLVDSINNQPKNLLGKIEPKKLDEIKTMVANAITVENKIVKKFALTNYKIKRE